MEELPTPETPSPDAELVRIKAERDRLLETLRDLLEWEVRMGGWEAAVWERARQEVARAEGKSAGRR